MEIFSLSGCGSATLDDYERCQAAIIIVINTCAVCVYQNTYFVSFVRNICDA